MLPSPTKLSMVASRVLNDELGTATSIFNSFSQQFRCKFSCSAHTFHLHFSFYVSLFAILFLFKGSKDKLTALNSPAFPSYYTEVTLAQCK
jgi:hypothetical protein